MRSLLSISVHVYGAAAVLYLAYLIRQSKLLPAVGRVLVGSGLVLHGASLGASLFAQGGVPVGIAQGFSTVALLLLGIFFFLDVRYRVPVIGAFLMPIALAVLVPGLIMTGTGEVLPPGMKGPLLPLHITIALLGIAAFGVASGVAVMYLLMERQMKGKKFGVLFARLPPLQFLDELNRRLVVWGFIALSVTLVTGAFFVSDAAAFVWRWRPTEVATLVAWLGFGALLHARFFAGWQGKRVALLTMAGFFVLLVSLVTAFPAAGLGGVQ
ncbi:MAG: cytochrome c biogenesis protein CcsA [Myxococcales bacterium]|nr:cytochrome c biogenesis protein CcsA [Myxococcales bacterium]